jgi:hypothetical protein
MHEFKRTDIYGANVTLPRQLSRLGNGICICQKWYAVQVLKIEFEHIKL